MITPEEFKHDLEQILFNSRKVCIPEDTDDLVRRPPRSWSVVQVIINERRKQNEIKNLHRSENE